jgi:hypothetical protein
LLLVSSSAGCKDDDAGCGGGRLASLRVLDMLFLAVAAAVPAYPWVDGPSARPLSFFSLLVRALPDDPVCMWGGV